MRPKPETHRHHFELPAWLMNAPHAASQTFLVTREAIRRVLFEDPLTMDAAAIAFYGLLSFGPLILVLLAIGGLVLSGSEDMMNSIRESLTLVFPAAQEKLVDQLTSFVSKSKVFGLVGVIGLLWSGSRIFGALDNALNQIWRVKESRPYWKHRLLAMSLVPLLLLVFLASLAATAFYSHLMNLSIPGIGVAVGDIPIVGDLMALSLPLLLSWVLFFLLYWFLPARGIPRRSAFIGSFVAAVLWELAKLGFDVYVRNFGRMDTVYGTAAGIVVLMLWFYYSAMIFLVGAVVGASDMDRRITLARDQKPRPKKKKAQKPREPEGGD
jgi:membrane protein